MVPYAAHPLVLMTRLPGAGLNRPRFPERGPHMLDVLNVIGWVAALVAGLADVALFAYGCRLLARRRNAR